MKRKTGMQAFSLILVVIVGVFLTSAGAAYVLPENPSYENFNGSDTGSLYLSHENLSPREVTDWRDRIPTVRDLPPNPGESFRYEAVFFPDIPPDAEVVGCRAQVLPDGVAASYAEVTDVAAPAPDGFSARAEDWISGGEARAVCGYIRDAAGLSDEYVEVAYHTTVRRYPGVGQITATTALYQSSADGDPGHEYFCLGSYIAMTPEDGWRNSGFRASYDLNAPYYSLKPFDGFFSQSGPQISPRYPASPGDVVGKLLNAFDIFGIFSGLFGHTVEFHVHDTTGVTGDPVVLPGVADGLHAHGMRGVTWTTGCGYLTSSAAGPLNLTPVSQVVGIQPAANDTAWHVLAGVGIDAEPGWSRPGGQPPSSSPWGHLVFIRQATEEA